MFAKGFVTDYPLTIRHADGVAIAFRVTTFRLFKFCRSFDYNFFHRCQVLVLSGAWILVMPNGSSSASAADLVAR